MKILLKALFVAFLVFMGIQLYSCSSQRTYQKELVKAGNIAYEEGDFSVFKGIFEYYQEEPHEDVSISLVDGDNRPNVENKDISFDLIVFLQAEKGKNHITVILTDLIMENPEYSLKTVIKKDGGSKILEENLFRLSKNNWYIQYFEFDADTFDSIIISHVGASSVEPIILYDSSKTEEFKESFLSKENNDIASAIKEGKLTENGIVKREKDPFEGKGAFVYVVLAIYVLIAGILVYAVFYTKKGKNHVYVNEKRTNNNTINEEALKEEDKEN